MAASALAEGGGSTVAQSPSKQLALPSKPRSRRLSAAAQGIATAELVGMGFLRGVNDKPRYTKLARADARLCGREVVQWEAEACERKKAWVARRARSRENCAYYEQPLG
jgi:hypothetical protein